MLKSNCPVCGDDIRYFLWIALFGDVACSRCGSAKDWPRVVESGNNLRILLPPDKVPHLKGVLALGLGFFVMLSVASGVIVPLMFLPFVVALVVVRNSKGPLNGLARFLRCKVLVCSKNTIDLQVLSEKPQSLGFDCCEYNAPTVGISRRDAPAVEISCGDLSVKLGHGLGVEELREIVGALRMFVSQAVARDVCEDAPEDEPAEPIVIEDQVEDGQVSTKTVATVEYSKDALIVETDPRWDGADWLKVFVVAVVVAFVLSTLWRLKIGFGITIGLGSGVLCLMLGIKVLVDAEELRIKYTLFSLIHWERRIPVSEVLSIGETMFANCAVHTAERSYRVTHFNGFKSRYEVARAIERALRQRVDWKPRCRFSVTKDKQGRPSSVTLPPGGLRWFAEAGLSPMLLVPYALIGIPLLSALLIGLPWLLIVDEEVDEIYSDLVMKSGMGVIAAISVFLLLWSMKICAWVAVEPWKAGGELCLVVHRSMFRTIFNLNEPIDISCTRDDEGKANLVTLIQGDRQCAIGGGLDWHEQQELVKILEGMANSVRQGGSCR